MGPTKDYIPLQNGITMQYHDINIVYLMWLYDLSFVLCDVCYDF